ncbi:PfkB domain-containing protein [Catenovulum agarivorans DS-2]|uniref:PfkB domain-containing protein n=1 Tax=Catenovulum agarivorans DS-2 TaxID=1328313 RepID=W7QRS0_9ALTE|nr:sugar kinase [Catenovulum agarivorans]EWH11712.1 PfkB domain-containing protein [Catenovulum agarivorans DS-2]
MTRLLSIGECMMELNAINPLNFKRAFAGDTYNTAVYAQRWAPELSVYYMSAIGSDSLSEEMLAQFKGEGLKTDYVFRQPDGQIGLYSITRDAQDQRCVNYWRKESAATQLMQLFAEKGGVEQLRHFDVVYFTGISLGILADEDKTRLLDLIAQLRERGSLIAFDPNYRAKLWQSPEQAKHWYEQAYQLTDIALPGLTDHQNVYGHRTHQEVKNYVFALGCKEVVVKSSAGIYAFAPQIDYFSPVVEGAPCIDTTAAGDSFAGTYLAARMQKTEIDDAIAAAANVAQSVIRHVGAITH